VIPEAQVAAEIAKKIIAIVSEPVLFKHIPLVVGCSIGISLYPDHADNSLNLRRAADFAMYGVKRAAKNNFAFSDAGKTGKAENSTREDPIVSV
jgi:GGDEF domain-containing protein